MALNIKYQLKFFWYLFVFRKVANANVWCSILCLSVKKNFENSFKIWRYTSKITLEFSLSGVSFCQNITWWSWHFHQNERLFPPQFLVNLIVFGERSPERYIKWGRLWLSPHRGELTLPRWFWQSQKDCIEAKDEDQKTPLHIASIWGQTDVVKYLVSKGAHKNGEVPYNQ